jgi:hypothetical protein
MAIEWLIDPPPFLTWKSRGGPDRIPSSSPDASAKWCRTLEGPVRLPSAIRGKLGGDCGVHWTHLLRRWGRVSRHHEHARNLAQSGRPHDACSIAFGREQELIDNGRWTLHPGGRGAAREVFRIHLKPDAENKWASPEMLADWFRDARSIAMVNNSARTAYLEQMMARGEHPDTHPEIGGMPPPASHSPNCWEPKKNAIAICEHKSSLIHKSHEFPRSLDPCHRNPM